MGECQVRVGICQVGVCREDATPKCGAFKTRGAGDTCVPWMSCTLSGCCHQPGRTYGCHVYMHNLTWVSKHVVFAVFWFMRFIVSALCSSRKPLWLGPENHGDHEQLDGGGAWAGGCKEAFRLTAKGQHFPRFEGHPTKCCWRRGLMDPSWLWTGVIQWMTPWCQSHRQDLEAKGKFDVFWFGDCCSCVA